MGFAPINKMTLPLLWEETLWPINGVGKNPNHLKSLLKNRKRTQLSFSQLPSSFKQEGTKGIEGYASFKFLPSFLDI